MRFAIREQSPSMGYALSLRQLLHMELGTQPDVPGAFSSLLHKLCWSTEDTLNSSSSTPTLIEMTALNGTTCDAQQYLHGSVNPSITCLSRGQSIGIVLTAEASFISFVCVLVIFILIGRNVIRHRKALQRGDLKLLRVPSDIYILSILMFDIIHATGGIINVRWAHDGHVRPGPYCSAQGIMRQIGNLGTTLITLILALHMFIGALWGIGIKGSKARNIAFGFVGFTWAFTVLWVGIGNAVHKNYEAPSPYSCWISPRFKVDSLTGDYIWMWMALFASVVIYIPLYLWAEGHFSIGNKWYKFRLAQPDQRVTYAERRASLGILLYPLAYSLVVLPPSVTTWSWYGHKVIPFAALCFGQATLNLSGAINVLLFLIIRPRLLLFGSPDLLVKSEAHISRLNTVPLPDTVQHDDSPVAMRIELPGLVDGPENRTWNLPYI